MRPLSALLLIALAGCAAPELETVEDVQAACQDGSLELLNLPVQIDSVEGCAWDTGDNLPAQQGIFAAYTETVVNVLPPDSRTLVCGMDLDFDGDWLYDDDFFLTWNQAIIAGSKGQVMDEFSSWEHFPLWDWEVIVDLDVPGGFGGGGWQPYCAGEGEFFAECDIPDGRSSGPGANPRSLDREYEEEIVWELGLRAMLMDTLDIGVAVTGDNDDGDCSHADLDLTIEAQVITW